MVYCYPSLAAAGQGVAYNICTQYRDELHISMPSTITKEKKH